MTGDRHRLTRRQNRRVIRAVKLAEAATGVQFCVYLGPTGEDARAHAVDLFARAGLHTLPAILLLVAPEARRVEVVTSAETRRRVSDRTCAEAVDDMTRHFERADIAGGIVAGIERLRAAVGPPSGRPPAEPLPDLIEG